MIRVQSFVADFWMQGCHTFTNNLCRLLRASGREVNLTSIRALLLTIPRHVEDMPPQDGSFFGSCMLEAVRRSNSFEAANELIQYFCDQVPRLSYASRQMLEESLLGTLSGYLEATEPSPDVIVKKQETPDV